MSKKPKNPDHLSIWRLLAFKSSDISSAWVNVIVLNYLSIYASDTLGVSTLRVGTLLLASKIFDAITDLFAGILVDSTKTKLGRGRTYEPAIIGMTICTVLLFSGKPEWSDFAKSAWIFCMYSLTFAIFSTLRLAALNPYTIGHFSNNAVLLKKVASFGGIVTMAGSILVSVGFPMIMKRVATSASGWTRAVLIIMIPATLIGMLRFIFCKEDPNVDAGKSSEPLKIKDIVELFSKNKYVWLYAVIMLCYNIGTNLACGSYYFKYIIGDLDKLGILSMFGVILLPLMLLFPMIMKKIGSMGKMIAVFSGIGVVGYIIVFFSGANYIGVCAGYLLATLAGLPIAYYGILFVMNICNYNERIGLRRMEASSSTLANFFSKLGAALGSYVTGLVLFIGGYISEADATQPASAIMAIRIDYAIVPMIFMVIMGVCAFAFSKLEKDNEAYLNAKKAKAALEK